MLVQTYNASRVGSPLNCENHKNWTPRKFPAVRYLLQEGRGHVIYFSCASTALPFAMYLSFSSKMFFFIFFPVATLYGAVGQPEVHGVFAFCIRTGSVEERIWRGEVERRVGMRVRKWRGGRERREGRRERERGREGEADRERERDRQRNREEFVCKWHYICVQV